MVKNTWNVQVQSTYYKKILSISEYLTQEKKYSLMFTMCV